jgi:D-alanyl-D-alanine carboxypeptidase (penicillin-binding protein 5/6)
MRLISVVMGTVSEEARAIETQKLLTYGFRYFETHKLYRADEVLKTERIWYGDQEQVSLGVGKDIYITIPRGRYRDLDASMEIDSEISAPIGRGQSLGQVNIKLDDDMILSESIVAMQAVNEGGLIDQAMDKIKLMFR